MSIAKRQVLIDDETKKKSEAENKKHCHRRPRKMNFENGEDGKYCYRHSNIGSMPSVWIAINHVSNQTWNCTGIKHEHTD